MQIIGPSLLIPKMTCSSKSSSWPLPLFAMVLGYILNASDNIYGYSPSLIFCYAITVERSCTLNILLNLDKDVVLYENKVLQKCNSLKFHLCHIYNSPGMCQWTCVGHSNLFCSMYTGNFKTVVLGIKQRQWVVWLDKNNKRQMFSKKIQPVL